MASAVAENIHRHKDQLHVSQSADGLPVPFRTVARGIKEEISPQLASLLNPDAIYLLGICFDLDVFEPDLLFLVALPVSLNDFRVLCREHRGVDFHEGDLKFARALPDEPALIIDLSKPAWLPTGQASLMRAVQFIQAVCNESGSSVPNVAQELSNGRVPFA
ncbi:MAG: hypothetical protein EPO64_09810 [Nitrospirae bacterium]|nr:MAG: hypothetical protein EPO64_09810 [Nitrospirota bacterium]